MDFKGTDTKEGKKKKKHYTPKTLSQEKILMSFLFSFR